MYIKEIVMCDESMETTINTDSLFLTEMFQWELKRKIKTTDCEAVFIHCGNYKEVSIIREEQEAFSMLVPKKSIDVAVPLDRARYKMASISEKKNMLANVLMDALVFLAEKKKWDGATIDDAFRRMHKKKLTHYFKPWKKQTCPKGKRKAYPMVKLDLDHFVLEVLVEAESKVIQKETILTIDPDFHKLWYYMKELSWISETEVALFTRANKGAFIGIECNQ